MKCICGERAISSSLPVCRKCAKSERALAVAEKLHDSVVAESLDRCLCGNGCDESALCGRPFFNYRQASAEYYFDPLPTNCCNAWFCEGSRLSGYNLAVFYYGCNFDCLFCQNWIHKSRNPPKVGMDELLKAVERAECICHFGGSPEPQLPFAIRFSRKALKIRDVMICWEWNGAGNRRLALKAAELSYRSGGTVKFDLKAWNPNLHVLLTGRSNTRTIENFEKIAEKFPDVISATTLLVPHLVDEGEVESIARFIASIDDEIPYSLLVFHPDYKLKDLPVTPLNQVVSCYRAAKKHLKNVNIGNLHLLGISGSSVQLF